MIHMEYYLVVSTIMMFAGIYGFFTRRNTHDEKNSLINVLNDTLCQWESIYGTVPSEVNPELRFKGIIRRAYEQTGQRVVILVDEYDKPMLQ